MRALRVHRHRGPGVPIVAMGHDVPDRIRAQHADLRRLIEKLDRQPAVTEQILQPQLRARRQVFRTLQRTFVAYQSARLRHLWPVLRRAWPDGRVYTDQAWKQTRRIEDRMAKRPWLGERDEATTDLDRQIAVGIEALLTAEEDQLPRLEGTTMSRRLGDGYWPTRPHPDVPRAQRLASILQRPLALSDRVLDRCAHTTEVREDP